MYIYIYIWIYNVFESSRVVPVSPSTSRGHGLNVLPFSVQSCVPFRCRKLQGEWCGGVQQCMGGAEGYEQQGVFFHFTPCSSLFSASWCKQGHGYSMDFNISFLKTGGGDRGVLFLLTPAAWDQLSERVEGSGERRGKWLLVLPLLSFPLFPLLTLALSYLLTLSLNLRWA